MRLLLYPPTRIRERLDELYRPEDVVSKLLSGISDDSEVTQLTDEPDEYSASAEEAQQRPIIKLVDTLIADGITSRASDIHVEPSDGGVSVRYRIDGVLRQVMKIPRSAGLPLVSRVKIMSGMDIADRLRPQDGRCRVAVNGSPVDLRVSTLPASLGEKLVIRILNAKATVLSLDALGLQEDEQKTMAKLLQNKEGILLVTGPTGSGKTTTLYAALRQVQGEGVNIVTVEDPVEYRLGPNIVQVQVNEKAGLTFAAALRSILRQDPDVVLIGEIRDQETAQIAVQASLTGHLVLSTLHTNDAPNAVTRLVDMGMEAYKIASALRGILAQRLLRRLCPICKIKHTDPLPERIKKYLPGGPRRALSGRRLRRVRHDRLPGAVRHRGDSGHDAGAGAADRAGRHRRPDRRRGQGGGHALALRERDPARRVGRDVGRGAAAGYRAPPRGHPGACPDLRALRRRRGRPGPAAPAAAPAGRRR